MPILHKSYLRLQTALAPPWLRLLHESYYRLAILEPVKRNLRVRETRNFLNQRKTKKKLIRAKNLELKGVFHQTSHQKKEVFHLTNVFPPNFSFWKKMVRRIKIGRASCRE